MGYLDKVDKLINHSRVEAAAAAAAALLSGWKFSFSFFRN